MANFDVELNDEVENFTVEFGEIQRITVDDFDKLRNRPSYAGHTMTHETNIPEVPTAVSQLTNDTNYQTGSEVENAISTAVGDEKDAREQADAGLSRDIEVVDGKVDAEADARERADIALQGAIDDEETARKNADNGLQGQIDAITSSSDVVDIVGTYAELLQYPTAGLGDKDVIKVLQDETHNDAMSYYRWNKSSSTWSYIGSEGPYYTKSETNTLLGDKQDTLTAGSNVTIQGNTISATDTTYTAGNGLTLTGTEFSADTTVLQPKLTAGDGINISAQNVISADIDPADFFTASETVDGTGSEMTLNNTIQAKIKSVQMDGDTFQQTYSGKNLLYVPNGTNSSAGIDWTVTNDTITGSGTVSSSPSNIITARNFDTPLGSGTYTFSISQPISYNIRLLFREGATNHNVGTIEAGQTSATFTTNWTTTSYNVHITGLSTGASFSLTMPNKLQVESGSTATSYEPYTGGIPAPNPDYPQDVQTVTGEQNVYVHGKNLFRMPEEAQELNGVVFTPNEDGTFNIVGTATANAVFVMNVPLAGSGIVGGNEYTISSSEGIGNNAIRYFIQNIDDGGHWVKQVVNFNRPGTFTLSDTVTEYLQFQIRVDNGVTVNYQNVKTQIEAGSSATTFQPHQSQSYTIDLGSIELCKIGDYQDNIYKSGDDWYVHKEAEKMVLDGATNAMTGVYGNGMTQDYNFCTKIVDDMKAGAQVGYCSYLTSSTGSPYGANRETIFFGTQANNYIYMGVFSSRTGGLRTLAAFNTYLETHPATIYYALATATDTKITDATLISELNALADALGYKDKTIITVSATGTNLPAILEVSAYRNCLTGVLGVIGRAEAA